MNQWRRPKSIQSRPTLHFSPYRPILAERPQRSILRREVAIPIDARTVLMHADNGRVDHLHCVVTSIGESVHDFGPDARSPTPNKTVIAGRVRAEVVW